MFNYISRRSGPGGAQRNEQGRGTNGAPAIHELGAMLRKRREAMGATLAEVEMATKIRQKYLAALEADEWQLLPGEVVGRGFLRNYATYLGLDANELIERRRAVADPGLASALAGTSAGSALPPPRQVDYRPKDVPLHEEPDGIEQRREVNFMPLLTVAGMVLLLLAVIWLGTTFGGRLLAGAAGLVDGVQGWATTAFAQPTATPTEATLIGLDGVASPTATPTATLPPPSPPAEGTTIAGGTVITNPTGDNALGQILIPTPTPPLTTSVPAATPAAAVDPATAQPPAQAAAPTPAPTETPSPTPLPTDTPAEQPTPTETPTETPTTAPPVTAPVCPDARSVLTAPGVNAVVSGDVQVTGRAAHEAFQYYKVEFAPGANAGGGFVYFGGANTPVEGGLLATFSTGAVPNGAYTLQLTVVDQTGNFPPPCQVTIFVQN